MNEKFLIDGRILSLSHLDKPFWPRMGVTKKDLMHYYLEISPFLLPHLKDRLITVIRFPDGVEGKFFYQKNKPRYAPEWIPTFSFQGTDYMLVQERATLIYLANQGALEIHVSFHKVPGEEPTSLVFDLDPSVEGFEMVREAALLIKEELDLLRLPSLVKTSGATGLQIYIPLKKGHTFPETRRFSSFFARYMTEKNPSLFTIERKVDLREGKIYFDYLQHWRGKSLIAPYSTRARSLPCVSTPLRWEEVPRVQPEDFTLFQVLERVQKVGDLFSPLLQGRGSDLAPFLKEIARVKKKPRLTVP
ncbi:conserved hypothetical protein [[Clostridium] ultunense Esp]|nr:conserved hypothetical protein [[Clostridium] ultunense Esp]